MNNKHLLVVAIVLGVLAVVLVNRTISDYEAKADIQVTTLFQAEVDIAPGDKSLRQAINEKLIVPIAKIPMLVSNGYPSALRDRDVRQNMDEQIHRGLRAGEFLQHHHLERATEEEVRRSIPSGKRLIALTVSRITSTGYFIRPGDHVDLYQIRQGADPSARGGTAGNVERIAESVEVFSVDSEWKTEGGGSLESKRGERYGMVTLAVEEALLRELMIVRDYGQITLVPRTNPVDGSR